MQFSQWNSCSKKISAVISQPCPSGTTVPSAPHSLNQKVIISRKSAVVVSRVHYLILEMEGILSIYNRKENVKWTQDYSRNHASCTTINKLQITSFPITCVTKSRGWNKNPLYVCYCLYKQCLGIHYPLTGTLIKGKELGMAGAGLQRISPNAGLTRQWVNKTRTQIRMDDSKQSTWKKQKQRKVGWLL